MKKAPLSYAQFAALCSQYSAAPGIVAGIVQAHRDAGGTAERPGMSLEDIMAAMGFKR